MYNLKFSVSLTKESKYSEILLNKNNKCFFTFIYIYIEREREREREREISRYIP